MVTEELLYDARYSINTAILSKSIKKIRRNSIRQLGENLCGSLGLVNKMIGLPSKLLALLHFERSVVFYDTKARILAQLTKSGEDNFEEAYLKELDKVMESEFLPVSEKIAEGAVEGGKNMFKEMLEKNEIGLRETYDAILDSSTVWIWCSFEVLMRELWKQSLNEGGKYLGNVVIKKLQSQDGKTDKIQGKYIRLDYLAKFNYDVSKDLGTILLDKFDFTSCSGICEAYECAFPRSVDIKKALISKKLNELEAARNVIVHNAGIIDSDFCRRTSTSLAEIEKRIRLNNRKVCEYGNAVAEVGIAMMLAVYRNMAYIRSEVKKQIGE
jgi:hypothetical protein